MPLKIHWTFPVKIHWASDNQLEHATENPRCFPRCRFLVCNLLRLCAARRPGLASAPRAPPRSSPEFRRAGDLQGVVGSCGGHLVSGDKYFRTVLCHRIFSIVCIVRNSFLKFWVGPCLISTPQSTTLSASGAVRRFGRLQRPPSHLQLAPRRLLRPISLLRISLLRSLDSSS